MSDEINIDEFVMKLEEYRDKIFDKMDLMIEEIVNKMKVKVKHYDINLFEINYDKLDDKIDEFNKFIKIQYKIKQNQDIANKNNPQMDQLTSNTDQKLIKQSFKSQMKKNNNNTSQVIENEQNEKNESSNYFFSNQMNKFVYIINDDKFYQQCLERNEWTEGKNRHLSRIPMNCSLVQSTYHELQVIGGVKPQFDLKSNAYEGKLSDSMFKLGPLTDQQKSLCKLRAGRAQLQSFYIPSMKGIISIGGYIQPKENLDQQVTNIVDFYDISQNVWRGLKSMRTDRVDFASCQNHYNHSIQVIGGRKNDMTILDTIEVQQISINEWQLLSINIEIPMYRLGCVFLDEKQLMICGGLKQDEDPVLECQWIQMPRINLKLETDQFVVKEALNISSINQGPRLKYKDQVDYPNGEMLMSNERICFMGKNSLQIFEFNDNEWTMGQRLNVELNNYNQFVV